MMFKIAPATLKNEEETTNEHELRVQKVAQLREMGNEPWAEKEPIVNTSAQVIAEFKDDNEIRSYIIAGRIMALRLHGKAAFAQIQDRTGKTQIYIKTDDVGADQFNFFKELIDIGDIIACKGTSFRTKTGEITIHVTQFKLLSKCLHPLPEKFHGLTHIETKYRQRYLDLMTNPESRQKFLTRTHVITLLRDFLNKHDFIEVETPMLHPIPGGAAARPFVTHHNALDMDLYLRIAPELYLKRLVVGGFERVYEINRNFRNEGISTRHNPEFTMLEFYMAHEDYLFIMGFVEELLRFVLAKKYADLQVPFGDQVINFAAPFRRLTVRDAVKEYAQLTDRDLEDESLNATLKRFNVVTENRQASSGEKIFALFEELVENKLIQPTFIIDYPIEVSPLAKRDPKNPAVAERFELFIAGFEVANGFNELNDPFDQAQRFEMQAKAHAGGDQEAMRYDADYIMALEYGLPPTVGVGIGVDRLVMLATNTLSIKDVILFPTLKRK